MLEENGILVRKVYAEIPPRVDYTLTAIGYNLKPVIESMVAWAEEYREILIKEFKDIDLKQKINELNLIA
jgi:DNA-binding HxlR family transcriptional regulator